ncbi:MAG: cyclic nucleotide-binding domain-containing protein [Magnetococcales bacterium]|nr:cyclic nucleotide-binding domain-containing protein [Magnetococcales bacterium]
MNLALLLAKTKLFEGVDPAALEQIAAFTERDIFEPKPGVDTLIFSEDDLTGPDLYLILSGEVTLNKELNFKGVAFYKKIDALEDEVYGEIAWLLKQKHLSDIHANSRVVLLRIDGNKLEQFLDQNPEIAAMVWKRISVTIARRLTWTFLKYRSTTQWDNVFKF